MNRHGPALPMILIAACLLFAAVPSAPAYDYTYARVVRLSLVDGDVQVARPELQGWEQALLNLPIQQGYTVATNNGRAEIEFESGATARLAENSVLEFTELALLDGQRITRLKLTQGTATFYANLAREDSFEVLSPSLKVSISDNARFRLDVSNDGGAVSVFKGNVEVESQTGSARLTKGHRLVYSAGDTHVQIERNPEADAWDRWVADRDEVVHTGNNGALQYVSSSYDYGLSDLYNFGSWYSVAGFGRCWRPSGVGFDWSPFWDGRWMFYPGLGWTWVSFERWGWLPYHFGSWILSPRHGWVWVPFGLQQELWHPGRVAWIRTGGRLCWVPSHPHDQPGQTPTNLQHGFVIAGSRGSNGMDRHERLRITQEDRSRIEMVRMPTDDFTGNLRRSTGNNGAKGKGGPSGKGDGKEVFFDPHERKFVNHSQGKGGLERDALIRDGGGSNSGGGSGSGPKGPSGPVENPKSKKGPVGPGDAQQWRDHQVPRESSPPTPSEPRPTPRTEQPPARSEPPRMSPPPRSEPPRASPPPRPSTSFSSPRGESRGPGGHRP